VTTPPADRFPRWGTRDGPWVFGVFFLGGTGVALITLCMMLLITGAVVFLFHVPPEDLPRVLLALSVLLLAVGPTVAILELMPQFVSALGAYATFAVLNRVSLPVLLVQLPLVGAAAVIRLQSYPVTRSIAMNASDWFQVGLICTVLQIPVTLTCWWLVRRVGKTAHPKSDGVSHQGANP
jgi:hypothetical protein